MCYKQEKDVDEVIPNLWLGNIKSAYNKDFMDKYNIKYVLTIMDSFDDKYKYNDITYLVVPIKDVNSCSRNMNEIFDISTLFILNALQNNIGILVHCKKGHHRSASIVAAFLIKYLKVNYISSMAYINYLRPCALVRKTCMADNLFSYYTHINNINDCNKSCGLYKNVYACKCNN